MTALHTPHLIAPSQVGDGRMVWQETSGDVASVVDQLRAYDDRLSLVRNLAENQWEVWRSCEDGEPRRVASRKGTQVPHGPSLIRFLAEHDTRRGFDPIADLEKHNAAVDRARDSDLDARFEESADKLAWAIGRDLGMPAQDGRIFTPGAAG